MARRHAGDAPKVVQTRLQRSPTRAHRSRAGGAAAERPELATPEALLTLQRQIGNHAVTGLRVLQRQPAPPGAKPVLRRGSHGEAVREAQRKLSRVQASALPLVEDGKFGPLTEAAVRTFQTTSGAVPTGVLGVALWAQLDTAFAALPPPIRAVLAPGTDHPDVGFAQQKLNALGINPRLVVNANYGPDMQPAIVLIEMVRVRRIPTGVIDAPVWAELDRAAPGGFTALEGASATPIEQHTGSGTADPRGLQVAGTSLHPAVGVGGLLRGAAVKELQQKLNTAGAAPALRVDGIFGPLTTAALRAFQTSRVPPLLGTGVADAVTWAAIDAAAPASTVGFVERQWTEDLGGATFGNTGGQASRYAWEVRGNRMLVTVKVNFTGLAPVPSWFDHVPAVWNTFKAVRDTPPARSVDLDFRMVRGTGGDAMTVNVQQGTPQDRSNAGTWFRADTQSAFTIPHEFGHLIGLQDEYQQRAGDYVRITGHEPPVGVTTAPPGQTPASIAQALQNAMVARSDVNASAAAPGLGMTPGAFAQRVVAAYAALPVQVVPAQAAVPAAPGVPAVPALPAYTLTGDLVRDLDRSLPNTIPRYNTIQVFTYSSGSVMGDPRRAPDVHDHGSAPRHVAEFVAILGRSQGGTWRAVAR
jgi:peptidoglycan hydrolase-like protein with peptidoglycan-binding domain